ncbi:MAG: D-glycero-alpha-D-manno-heptose-1,7-bisphosphate 7-phosphatase [Xanthobacteraceae bacterium]
MKRQRNPAPASAASPLPDCAHFARSIRATGSRVEWRRAALILDRDGVINVDHGYVHRADQFELVAGILELTRFWAHELAAPIVVVSNQSGIGRGYFDERAYADLTHFMHERFAADGVSIARVYHCPYHPEHGIGRYRAEHPWRKPNPGMILEAAKDLDLDLANSVMIGDQESDMAAAAAAGVGLRILLRDAGDRPATSAAHRTVTDLTQALAILRVQFQAPAGV